MINIVTPELSQLRLPPHDTQSEQAVIGALLLSHGQAYDRIDWLPPEAFYVSSHRNIYAAIVKMVESGIQVDAVTVSEYMKGDSDTRTYIQEISLNTPSAANIQRYAEIVRDRWQRRRVIATATEAADKAFDTGSDAKALAEHAEQSFLQILSNQTGEEVSFEQAIKKAMADRDDPVSVVPTKLRNLDFKLSGGGFRRGHLVVIAGRPSMGKTALALQIAEHVAQDETVAVFSLEMQHGELAERALRYHENLTDTITAASRLLDLKMRIDDTPAVSVGHIRLRCRRIQRKHGLSLVVVDYLQLMRGTGENRTQEIGSISRALKALAKELDVPVVLLSQLNRGVESRPDKHPIMSDLRESGDIEQDADVILMLYRDEYYHEGSPWTGLCEVLIRKQRGGPTGSTVLTFKPEVTRFADYSGPTPSMAPAAPRGGKVVTPAFGTRGND